MKKLSIEEKAKRYDEAIKVAKSKIKNDKDHVLYEDDVIEIFPELAQSEDERIRKELIQYLEECTNLPNGQYCRADFFAWLEKQGEHANFCNNIQVGDKVTRNQDGVLVNLSQLKRVAKPADKEEPKFKVGDTITDPTDSTFTFHINAIKYGKYMESDEDWVLIKEADSDYELVEQKPAWSDDFEEEMDRYIEENFYGSADDGFFSNRTKRELEVEDVVRIGCHFAAWQKEQSNKELSDKLKPIEWSEEDESHVKSILSTIECCKAQFPNAQAVVEAYNADIEWLKSPRPQNRWKPSEEQMDALRWVLNNVPYNKHKEEISGLLDQIKEL